MENLKLSVIMLAYNEGEQIRKILDKIVSLNNEKFELIVVDDGSTDCSPEILDEYAGKNKFITVFHQENQGCLLARRRGISLANGDYITFVDADDMIEDEYFDDFERTIKNDADFFILNNKVVLEDDKKSFIEKDFLKTGTIDKKIVEKWIIGNKIGAVWDKIFKTEIFKSVLDEEAITINFGEDILLNLQYLNKCNKVYCDNSSSYIHYMDSLTSVCKAVSFKRLHEIDDLYFFIFNNIKFLDKEVSEHIYDTTVVFNLVNTIYQLLKVNRSCDLDKELSALKSLKILKDRFQPDSIKDKIYFDALINRRYKIIKSIFTLRGAFR